MENIFYPLRFQPVYQTYLWGGHHLRETFGREDTPGGIVAESWEVSDREDGMSVVANGPAKGRSLRELMEAHGEEILGGRLKEGERFPLLIKVLDAARTLSVQVHPDDETAAKYGGEAKTEMWYVLDAAEDAVVYCGLKEGVSPEAFRRAIEEERLEEWLKVLPVHAGDAIFVPGGRVHAIGSGCLMLEVQQNSNTTYRIYDWGRVGADGRPRELHVDQALQVARWEDPESALTRPEREEALNGMPRRKVLESPYFRLEKLELEGESTLAPEGSFQVLFVEEGTLEVQGGGERVVVPRGSSVLLPAALAEAALRAPTGAASLIRITHP